MNNKIISRGYFNNKNTWKLHIEYKDDKICLVKRTNINYIEYMLSNKDIDFILTAMTTLWKTDSSIVVKQCRGKIITLSKERETISIRINTVMMMTNLTIFDCKQLYAILKELTLYGVTNKLECI